MESFTTYKTYIMNRKLLVPGMFIALASLVVACNEELTQINPSATKNSLISDLSQPTNTMNKSDDDDLKDSYIVVYKDNMSINALGFDMNALAQSDGVKADQVYTEAIKGYSAKISASTLAKLKKNPNIEFIEKDQIYTINTTQSSVPVWGIDRIDDSTGLDGKFTYKSTGTGVDAYIVDTGIYTSHTEFEGRAVPGFNSVGTSSTDQNGHGTHVAGTVGGKTWGVAKKVNLIAVRVLDATGSGTTSGVIAGINWAITHHTTRPAVANMSLGGGASAALDAAVQSAVADGIVMCVAAGNNTRDASLYSPSRVSTAITVGSSGAYPYPGALYPYNSSIGSTFKYDAYSSFSNYGSVVDIFAPGSGIRSAWYTSTTATNTLSGTSMATPHVTGVAALYLALNPSKTPAQVEIELTTKAKAKVTGMPSGTTNKLLFSSY
jgi:subtilisin family serine protease